MVEIACLTAFACLLAVAVVSDVRSFIIPNWVCIALLAAFIPWGALHSWHGVAGGVGSGLLMLFAGAALYAAGVWGGGDAKFLAAVAAWSGLTGIPRLLVVVVLAGGVVTALTVLRRSVRPGGVTAPAQVPYGVAIAAGGFDWWMVEFVRLT